MNIWRSIPVHVGLYDLVLKSQINVQKTTARDNLFNSNMPTPKDRTFISYLRSGQFGKDVAGEKKIKINRT